MLNIIRVLFYLNPEQFLLVKYFNILILSCLHRIIEENNGKAPLTFIRMQAIVKTLGPPKRPIPAPTMENMKGYTNNAGPCQPIFI